MKARVAVVPFPRTRLRCFFCVHLATAFGMTSIRKPLRFSHHAMTTCAGMSLEPGDRKGVRQTRKRRETKRGSTAMPRLQSVAGFRLHRFFSLRFFVPLADFLSSLPLQHAATLFRHPAVMQSVGVVLRCRTTPGRSALHALQGLTTSTRSVFYALQGRATPPRSVFHALRCLATHGGSIPLVVATRSTCSFP